MKLLLNSKPILAVALALTISVPAMAVAEGRGTGSSGGGNAVDCGQHLELLDLYEVQLRPGLKSKMSIVRTDEEVELQVERAFLKLTTLDPELGQLIQKTYASFKSDLVPITDEYAWAATDDVGLLPELKCKRVNVINYLSDDVAEINVNAYERLPRTDRAALRVHEVLYKIARDDAKATDSLAVRRIVALLFSDLRDDYLLGSLITSYIYSSEKRGLLLEVSPQDATETLYLTQWLWALDSQVGVQRTFSFEGMTGTEVVRKGFLGSKKGTGVYTIEHIDFDAMPSIQLEITCKGFSSQNCTGDLGLWLQKTADGVGNSTTIAKQAHIPFTAVISRKGFGKNRVRLRFVSPKTHAFIIGSLKD